MKINIQQLSFQTSDKLIVFALDKVRSLRQFSNEIIEAYVTLRVDRSDTKQDRFCQIRLSIPGNDVIASKQGQSFEEAILKTCEALKRQLSGRKRLFNRFPKPNSFVFNSESLTAH